MLTKEYLLCYAMLILLTHKNCVVEENVDIGNSSVAAIFLTSFCANTSRQIATS